MNGSITTKTVVIDSTNCGRIYQARLRHNCGGGMFSPWKFRPNIATTPCNRLGDFSEKMLVYPNPVDDMVTVQYHAMAEEIVAIEVHTLSGRVVYAETYSMTKGMNVTGIDVGDWANAVYVVSIQAGENRHFKKLAVFR